MRFYRLNELAAAADVTPRTIRYYIVEGLLPPPQGAGPAALYTVGHRDRLRLIAQLKDHAIPLREIGRRIAKLSDAKVRAELEVGAAPNASPEPVQGITQTARVQSPQRSPVPAPPAQDRPVPTHEQWQRLTLADGIELHIREDRRTDLPRLDTLIHHARTLLGDS